MAPIRIVLGNLPTLFGDIVRETLAEQSDLAVFSNLPSHVELSAMVALTEADVAIIGVSSADRHGLVYDLLRANPRLTVVALAHDGRTGCVYELRPHVTPLCELTPISLLAMVRKAGATGSDEGMSQRR